MIDETKGEWGDTTKYICEYSPLDSLLSQTVYTYNEAVKKWEKQEMIYKNAILSEKVYRTQNSGDYKFIYEDRYFYSPIKQWANEAMS